MLFVSGFAPGEIFSMITKRQRGVVFRIKRRVGTIQYACGAVSLPFVSQFPFQRFFNKGVFPLYNFKKESGANRVDKMRGENTANQEIHGIGFPRFFITAG